MTSSTCAGLSRSKREHVVQGDELEEQRRHELVEHDDVVLAAHDEVAAASEAVRGGGEVLFRRLALDHPVVEAALPHLDAEPAQHDDLAPGRVGLHELQDGDAQVVAEGAQDEAERGGRLALAVAGVDLDEPFALLARVSHTW